MQSMQADLGTLQGEVEDDGEEVFSHLAPDLPIQIVQWP